MLPKDCLSVALAGALLIGTAVGRAAEAGPQTAYLFTSFRGNGDGLHLAYSTNGYAWTDLDRVFLTPTVGGKLLRDPHLLRGPDGMFHMVWTSGWGDRGIGYASSSNLIHWSEQRYLPLMENTPGTKTCWAPETYYDALAGQYMILWSSNVETPGSTPPKGGYHRAYYVLTKDFKTFTVPKILFDPGFNNIDATLLVRGNKHLLVFKETDDQPAGKWGAIYAAEAEQPLGPYRLLKDPIIANERVEGPALLALGDKTLLYADYYVNHRYGVRETIDWKMWRDATGAASVVSGQRHGSLLPISTAELLVLAPESGRAVPAPALPGANADPHIAFFKDTFYLYPTTDGTEGWRATSFHAWSSRDLRSWKDEGVILDLPRDLGWADLHAWAPAIATRNGKYYFYFSAGQNIGVAVADRPQGPFKDPIGKPLVAKGAYPRMQAIDPMVFVDDDGAAYLYWGQGRCKAVRVNDDMVSFNPDEVRDITPTGYNEGPFVHRRLGKYYLSWSEYDTRDPRYSVAYGTADSPLGPFTKAPANPILRQSGPIKSAGHHSIVQLPGRDEWVIAYHRFRIPGGNGYNRETCLSPLQHAADGRILPVDVFAPANSTAAASGGTWKADNGDGTFTNPLFYDEFSDPDLIRVGDDFYLTGTTMHTMPGLPVLHSQDLVNWEFLGYAVNRLDLGPEFRLEGGKSIYGQGIWAPSFRFHKGKYYIFTNVNGRKTQLFTATNPAGPWAHRELKRSFHDLSVLFDDDGKTYVIWGYQDIKFAQLTDDLSDVVPGSERTLISRNAGMGEGVHFYKIGGKYYITSAWFAGRMRMPCARADKPEGPYEVNPAISTDEDFGLAEGNRLAAGTKASPFNVIPDNTMDGGRMSLHQGGLVQTPTGEWWGFSMMDYNSVGRLTCLSPVTWTNGWPYFGLPGNLTRTPRTWVKPNTGRTSPPAAPYQRDDEFTGPQLVNVWQWNHVPDETKWSLTERPGFLRLHSLPAADFWNARNTLTQRAIGPESTPTAELDASGLKPGDIAGLALLNHPYAWIGVSRSASGFELVQFDERTGKTARAPFAGGRVWLRAHGDFLTEKAGFSCSTDGKTFRALGDEFAMVFQLRTFQGVRYALFNFNTNGAPGGPADFDRFTVDEAHPRGLMQPIPFGKTITLVRAGDGAALNVAGESRFKVVDRGLGRVALQSGRGYVSVSTAGAGSPVTLKTGEPADAETFQWTETPYGDLILLSLATHRHLCLAAGKVTADAPGAKADRKNGACFIWRTIDPPGTATPASGN